MSRSRQAQDILVRDIPYSVVDWLEEERHRLKISRQELLRKLLENASQETQPTFFDGLLPTTQVPKPSDVTLPFKFIDLFAGVGGFRLGLQRVGGRCVFSSEWDKHSQKTYQRWYGEEPHGDITQICPKEIPDHDVLAAGFPCQPFSLAGVSKKNSLGREHGFNDVAQGTMFFHLANVIEIKRPPVVLLENVKNLKSHDGGRTWTVIKNRLEEMDYKVYSKIIDACGWVPQHRERIFIVCFDTKIFGKDVEFTYPAPPAVKPRLRDILEENPDPKYTLTDHLWEYLQRYAEKHREAGNGFGFGLANLEGVTRTLSARYHKDGSEILIPQEGKNPRRLTPRECARLMGFDDDLPIVVSDTQAYRQFGNSLCPLIAEAIGRQVIKAISDWLLHRDGCLLKGRVQRQKRQVLPCSPQ